MPKPLHASCRGVVILPIYQQTLPLPAQHHRERQDHKKYLKLFTHQYSVARIFVIFILLFLSACFTVTPNTINSGIEGYVFIGPNCPVVRVGQECPDQPYQAVLTVTTPGGKRVEQIQTDENGYFKIPLTPGKYILHPESPNVMPHAAEQQVIVETGKFTELTVNYDSGIR